MFPFHSSQISSQVLQSSENPASFSLGQLNDLQRMVTLAWYGRLAVQVLNIFKLRLWHNLTEGSRKPLWMAEREREREREKAYHHYLQMRMASPNTTTLTNRKQKHQLPVGFCLLFFADQTTLHYMLLHYNFIISLWLSSSLSSSELFCY